MQYSMHWVAVEAKAHRCGDGRHDLDEENASDHLYKHGYLSNQESKIHTPSLEGQVEDPTNSTTISSEAG